VSSPDRNSTARLFVLVEMGLLMLAFFALIGAWISEVTGGPILGLGQQHLYNDAVVLALLGIGCFLDAQWHAKDSS
jgi:hypothetical protein